jgi:hypothetical protein
VEPLKHDLEQLMLQPPLRARHASHPPNAVNFHYNTSTVAKSRFLFLSLSSDSRSFLVVVVVLAFPIFLRSFTAGRLVTTVPFYTSTTFFTHHLDTSRPTFTMLVNNAVALMAVAGSASAAALYKEKVMKTEPDFGLCIPTMKFEGGLGGRPSMDFTFLPSDPLCARGQQESSNPSTYMPNIPPIVS